MSIQSSEYEINDGTPHMTYQREGVDINFMWDGKPEHPILVCPYGYGEKPGDVIDTTILDFYGSPDEILRAFQLLCEAYLKTNPEQVAKHTSAQPLDDRIDEIDAELRERWRGE